MDFRVDKTVAHKGFLRRYLETDRDGDCIQPDPALAASADYSSASAADLRQALVARATQARAGKGLHGALALRRWLPSFILRKIGWVAWNDNPSLPLRYARIKTVMTHSLAEDRLG